MLDFLLANAPKCYSANGFRVIIITDKYFNDLSYFFISAILMLLFYSLARCTAFVFSFTSMRTILFLFLRRRNSVKKLMARM